MREVLEKLDQVDHQDQQEMLEVKAWQDPQELGEQLEDQDH